MNARARSTGLALLLLAGWVVHPPGVRGQAVPAADLPRVEAPGAFLTDAGSGQELYAREPDAPRAPASMTKLMTLVLALEAVNAGRVRWDALVPVSDAAYRTGGAQIWLEPGERITFRDLVRAIAVGSANDACVAVAEYLGGGSEGAFVARMNRLAQRLGMRHTRYLNPHGLDMPGHETTPRDMAILARYAVRVPGLLALTRERQDRSIRDGKGGTLWLVNPNRLLVTYPGADGLKTGFTAHAGYCVTATARHEGLRLIAVVMGDPTARQRNADATRLLDWGFSRYEAVEVGRAGQSFGSVVVRRGAPGRVSAVLAREGTVLVERGQKAGLDRQVRLPREVEAPVRRGQRLGHLWVRAGGRTVGDLPLVAAAPSTRLTGLGLFWDLLRRILTR